MTSVTITSDFIVQDDPRPPQQHSGALDKEERGCSYVHNKAYEQPVFADQFDQAFFCSVTAPAK